MTTFVLKLIAIISMTLDHTAAVLLEPGTPEYKILRAAGRLAFPIFCFLIVEGCEHTRSLKDYAGRVGVFAVFSEMPFDLAFHGDVSLKNGQNVYFTLLLGMLAVISMKKLSPKLLSLFGAGERARENRLLQLLGSAPLVAAAAFLADRLKTDYGWKGVILICIFYVLRDSPALAQIAAAVFGYFAFCTRISVSSAPNMLFTLRIDTSRTLQLFMLMSALPLGLYNGKPGEKSMKWFFYIFYPAHLLILVMLRAALH